MPCWAFQGQSERRHFDIRLFQCPSCPNDVSWSFICVRCTCAVQRPSIRQLSSADNTWGYMVPLPNQEATMSPCLPICMKNALDTPGRCLRSHVCPAQSAPITGNHRKFISVIGKEGVCSGPQRSHVGYGTGPLALGWNALRGEERRFTGFTSHTLVSTYTTMQVQTWALHIMHASLRAQNLTTNHSTSQASFEYSGTELNKCVCLQWGNLFVNETILAQSSSISADGDWKIKQ